METKNSYILSVNAGSSSIKVVAYNSIPEIELAFQFVVEGIGQTSTLLHTTAPGEEGVTEAVQVHDHFVAINVIMERLGQKLDASNIQAVGHRVVHGGPNYNQPVLITDNVLEDFASFASFDPDHMPIAIQIINDFRTRISNANHVACFDTSFYRDLPRVAQILPIPRKYEQDGLRRYGFHGLSYEYLLSALCHLEGENVANSKVIFAHLGSGVSLTATLNRKPIDTTMSFTPASGVPMSTRSGDIDPGLAWYLHKHTGLSPEQFNSMVNHESGLLGISETSADMYTLLQNEKDDVRSAEAVAHFCYQVRKSIGSLVTTLGGLDTLVFSGGMGEKAPLIRQRICKGLDFIDLKIDDRANETGEAVISDPSSHVKIRVIHTDEEIVIANQVSKFINDQNEIKT